MSRGIGSSGFDPEEIPWGQIIKVAPFVLLVLAVVYVGWRGVYTVAVHEEAVVLRFGRWHDTKGPGLQFMIPLVDEAVLVNIANHTMRLPFGLEETGDRGGFVVNRAREDEPLILTGDLYSAVVEWNVTWRVVDPKDFLFSIHAEHIEKTITAVARSVMHRIVGDYSADETILGKREEIGLAAFEEMQRVMETYSCGVNIVQLQVQRAIPPIRVKPAFDEVNASIQRKDQLVNEANRERNRLIPQAEAQQDKLIREAEGYADRRRAEAQGEIAALLAKYQAYKVAPDITRKRLYLEAMQEVLADSGPKTILDADLKSLLPMLQLSSEGGQGSRKEAAQ